MEALSPKGSSSSLISSPYSSPNLSSLLKIKVISWSQETGIPATICVRVGDKSFNLHKLPLCSKSGYFRRELDVSSEVELPPNFPGGAETFEMIALFMYGPFTFIDTFNVAALRCAAEFFEMTEEITSGNLCERTDLYLNHVILQSWDDTLIVLQKSQVVLPWSEELLIVSRCIESLAFMASMELLDPERMQNRPVTSLETLASKPWSCEQVKQMVCQDLWIKDLIPLPFGFFKRIIGSLRRQGMKEKYVSPIIVFYANKWVISKKARQLWECLSDRNEIGDMGNGRVLEILDGVLCLLNMGEKASRLIPVGFYFSLLARSLELGLTSQSSERLQDQIVSLLPLAREDDFLLPIDGTKSVSSSVELETMEKIFRSYVSSHMEKDRCPPRIRSTIAELWDSYLAHIAADPRMEISRFMSLIETVPISCRQSHDYLYKALAIFLQVHPKLTQEEKGSVCKYLNCQKLSQDVCIEAVQNELMPLRLIVQALFIQQLNTQQAFKECSESFRYMNAGEFSGSNPSSRILNFHSHNLDVVESPYVDGGETSTSRPLSCLLQREIANQGTDITRGEYESTSFRILNLEQQLMSLKKTLQHQKSLTEEEQAHSKRHDSTFLGSEGRSLTKKRSSHCHVTGCNIFSMNLAPRKKQASRIMKVLRRMSLFGIARPKRKACAPSVWPSP
ncbi:hypothetical protein Droror1_Dr00019458 [Drosera rotundifolia]